MKMVRLSDPNTGRLYLLGNIPGRSWLSRPQGHGAVGGNMSMKNSNDSSGIEPATFWLVVQCLNQLRYRVPRGKNMLIVITNMYKK